MQVIPPSFSVVVDVTGVGVQTLGPQLAPGTSYRVLGYSLSSQGTGLAIIKIGGLTVDQVSMPQGLVKQPLADWRMYGVDNGPLSITSDTGTVRIVGMIVYDLVKTGSPNTPADEIQMQEQVVRRQLRAAANAPAFFGSCANFP